MTAAGAIALVLTLVTCGCLVAIAVDAWSRHTSAEPEVGPWQSAHPKPPPLPDLPYDYRDLTWAQSDNWSQPIAWERLVRRLASLGSDFGVAAPSQPPPPLASLAWIDRRLHTIEEVAGPLPDRPARPAPPPPDPSLTR